MCMLRLFVAGLWTASVVILSTCGGNGVFELPPESLKLSNVSAAYLSELSAVRVSWLQIIHRDIDHFQIERAGPFEVFEPVPDAPDLEFLGEATAAAAFYEDPEVVVGKRYGYKVRLVFVDKVAAKITTVVESPLVWAIAGDEGDIGLPPPAGGGADICSAVTAGTLSNHMILQESAAGSITSPAVRLTARIYEARQVQLRWRSYAINTPFADPANPELGRAIGATSYKDINVATCSDFTYQLYEAGGGNLPDILSPGDYALVAEMRLEGIGASDNQFLGPFYRYVIPNKQADSYVSLESVTPDPMNSPVLKQGVQVFKANLVYKVRQTDGNVLSARLVGVDSENNERLLDIVSYDLSESTGQHVYSAALSLPTNTKLVRLIGRLSTGSEASVRAQDEIDYAVIR